MRPVARLATALFACTLAACAADESPARPAAQAPVPAAPAPAPEPAPTPPAPQVSAPTAEVPAAFVGVWNMALADCRTSRNDSTLTIAPTRITWWESSGPVTAVTVHDARDVDVTARVTGEGETRDSTTRFTLRDDGTLLATDAGGGTLVRQRCPAS